LARENCQDNNDVELLLCVYLISASLVRLYRFCRMTV
jgi:hypothetical protein